MENTLNYDKTIGKHVFSGLAGYTMQKSRSRGLSLNAGPFDNDLIETINAAPGITSWNETINEWGIISYLGRLNYAYDDRYLFTATLRSDGSSRFGENNRFALFPSAALAWRLSEEPFLKQIEVIDQLKLRTSYGRSGNNNIGNYAHLSTVNTTQYVFDNNTTTAAIISLSNPDLGWEESEQIDLGLDLSLWKERVSFTADLYRRRSVRMLLNDFIPTIPDFISYLSERERVFAESDVTIMNGEEEDWDKEVQKSFFEYHSNRENIVKRQLFVSGSELDILADYYWNNKKFNKHFYDKSYNGGSFELDGKWERYLEQQEVQNKKSADRASYFVDEFVKHEVLYSNNPTNLELAVELLSLSRFERRILGSELFSFATKYKNPSKLFMARRYGKIKDLIVAMVLYTEGMSHNGVMELIRIAVEGYSYMTNYREKKIAIIAFSHKLTGFRFGLLKDITPFEKDYEERLIGDLKMLKWFTAVEVFNVTHKEYPDR